MKRLNLILLLTAVTMALAMVISCKETNSDRLEKMRGEWTSTGKKPPFTLWEENGTYHVTVTKKSHAGNTRTETYQIRETDGSLFIETGLAVMLTYDKEKDRIHLSPGGEYKRSNHQLKNKSMKQVKAIIIGTACLLLAGTAKAQWVVSDPGNLAQGIINTTKQIVQTSTTAKNTLDNFNETVKIFEQGRKYYDALKAVHDVVKGGVKVTKSIELVADISEIYVRNYQKMLGDPNYTPDELSTISFGYAKLLSESADILQDLKNVVNVTGMSLTDAERLAIIDQSYKRLLEYRNLVQYYTNKNISVSYLRAKKKKDTDRVMALYGSADERYW